MSSLTPISSLSAESLAPHRHTARAKDAHRFSDTLQQSLTTPDKETPQTQTQEQPTPQTPPSTGAPDHQDRIRPSRETREARTNQSLQQKRLPASDVQENEVSFGEIRVTKDEAADALSEIDAATKSDAPPATIINEHEDTSLLNADDPAKMSDPLTNQNINVVGAPLMSVIAKEIEAKPITDKNNQELIKAQETKAKALLLPKAQAQKPEAEGFDAKNEATAISEKFSDIQPSESLQNEEINLNEEKSLERLAPSADKKVQTIALSPQAHAALLSMNKNKGAASQSDSVAESETALPNTREDIFEKNPISLNTTLPSVSPQKANEPVPSKVSETFRTLFDETSKADPVSPRLPETLDQNIPAPAPAPPSLIAPTSTVGAMPQLASPRITQLPVPYARVPMEIGLAALDGQRSLQVRLSPADLGTIDIELDVSDKSEIHARIAADDPRTLALLKQDAPLIKQALEQTGLSTTSDSLNFSLRQDNQSNTRQNSDPQNGWLSKSRGQNSSPDQGAETAPKPPPLRRVTSLLDLNI